MSAIKPVLGTDDPAAAGLDRWVVLVHGYRNSAPAAGETWTKTLKGLGYAGIDPRNLVLFYWPGDYSPSKALSTLSYSLTVPIAEDTAEELARYLDGITRTRSNSLQLSLVAHSLGSLVVLRTLANLRNLGSKVDVQEILLMAAAVPEGFCMPWETYGTRFSPTTKERILYSENDGVLKNWFVPGQALAGRLPEVRPDAVGRTGGPGSGDGERWTSATHMKGFGHSDYWVSKESIERIARVAGRNPLNFTLELEAFVKFSTAHDDILPIDDIERNNDELHRDEPFSPRSPKQV